MKHKEKSHMEGYGVLPYLGKTMKCIDQYINGKLKDANVDLTKKQFLVLKSLTLRGPLPQNDLAFVTERDKASLARFINTLEKKNLVARIPSTKDKRVNIIHLTTHGETTFKETEPFFKGIVIDVQKNIPEEDLEMLKNTLNKIKNNINSSETSCTNN